MHRKIAAVATLLSLALPVSGGWAQAADYRCVVERKLESDGTIYSDAEIKRAQFSILVEERGELAFLSRCSVPPYRTEITCDRYRADKVTLDRNVAIKKYYVFDSQFDVQIFSNLRFIENNGRGGIAFGTCKVVAP